MTPTDRSIDPLDTEELAMSTFTHLLLHEQRSAELAADAARARLARVIGRRPSRARDAVAPR